MHLWCTSLVCYDLNDLIATNYSSWEHSKICMLQGYQTQLWDGSCQYLLELVDLPALECWRLETWPCLLHKIIYELCCFGEGTLTLSTSLSHHTPLNLEYKTHLLCMCASAVHALTNTCTFHLTSLVHAIMSCISLCCYNIHHAIRYTSCILVFTIIVKRNSKWPTSYNLC